MSDATRAALEQAIRDHVADEADGETRLVTDWYLITAAVSEEVNVTNYLHVLSDSPTHVHIGLTFIAHRRMQACYDDID